jgi:hypothetical protein
MFVLTLIRAGKTLRLLLQAIPTYMILVSMQIGALLWEISRYYGLVRNELL